MYYPRYTNPKQHMFTIIYNWPRINSMPYEHRRSWVNNLRRRYYIYHRMIVLSPLPLNIRQET